MAERRLKNTPLDADGKHRQYRLRKVGTSDQYVNYFKSPDSGHLRDYTAHSQRPTFNKRGKILTTLAEAEEMLAHYALRRLRYPYDKADFPQLEIVVSVVVTEEVKTGTPPTDDEIKRLDRFSNAVARELSKTSGKKSSGDYSAEFAFASKLTFNHEPFRYILVTKGVIDRGVMKATAGKSRVGAVGRMNDQTICCFAVNSETDLTFARMALNEQLVTIWDYKTAKLVFGQAVSRY